VGYTAIQAARLSSCSVGQLDAWRRSGLVVPGSSDAAAPYGFRDLVALRMVRSLLAAGLPMARIRRAVGELVRAGEELAGLRLVTDGDTVWACRDDGQILDALRHGQLVLFIAVDRLAADVEHEVGTFDADRRAFVERLRGTGRAAQWPDHPSHGR
jgi:DNA-binding transcriptional MerR regulator